MRRLARRHGSLFSWDEWVPESRLLKLNEENQARQKQLMDAQLAKDRAERDALHAKEKEARHQGNASGNASGAGSSRRESGAPRGQKRARESAAATGDPVRRSSVARLTASGGRASQAAVDQAADPGRAEDSPGRRVGGDHEELASVSSASWSALTSQLVPLPRTPNVQQILQEYETHITNTKGDRAGCVDGMACRA